MNDEGLADAGAANPFRLPRLHPGIGLIIREPARYPGPPFRESGSTSFEGGASLAVKHSLHPTCWRNSSFSFSSSQSKYIWVTIRSIGPVTSKSVGRGIPLDRRPAPAENPVTRWLSALCPGGKR